MTTAARVDYLSARLDLLLDLGILNSELDRFWLTSATSIPLNTVSTDEDSEVMSLDQDVITPGRQRVAKRINDLRIIIDQQDPLLSLGCLVPLDFLRFFCFFLGHNTLAPIRRWTSSAIGPSAAPPESVFHYLLSFCKFGSDRPERQEGRRVKDEG